MPQSQTPEAAGSSTAADRRRWFALAVVMTAAFMDLVDVTIVNVAIPSVQRDLGASFDAIQWITGGYAMAFAVGLITGGRLGDLYGRKRIFLFGVGAFTVASALCGLAANPEFLITARILQGAAAALMVPQVLAIINVTFRAEERGKAFGMYGAIVGLGAVAGPVLGALLVQWNLFGLEWRPVFLVNLPIGIAGLILGRRFITESRSTSARRLDIVGMVMLATGTVLVLYPLTEGRTVGWPTWTFVLMGIGLAKFVLFAFYQRAKARKGGEPLVETSLFKVKSFTAGIGVQFVFGATTGVFFLVWTLYLQAGLGWSPLRAGLTAVPFSLGVGAAAGLSVELLVPKFGRKVLQAGALVMALGTLGYLWEVRAIGHTITTWQMLPALVVMGLGMGLIIAPLTDAILSEVPSDHSGSASGLVSTIQQVGWALGLGLVSVVFFPLIDNPGSAAGNRALTYARAFENSLVWVAAGLVVVFLLMFALPRQVRASAALPPEEGLAITDAPEPVTAADPVDAAEASLLAG